MTNKNNDLQAIRRINGRKLLSEYTSSKRFAEAAGIFPAQVSSMFGKNATMTIGDRMTRRLERQCFKYEGWMDVNHEAEEAKTLTIDDAAKCIVILIETLQDHDISLEDLDSTKMYHLLQRIFGKSESQVINRHYIQYMLVSHQMAELKKN